LTILSASIPLHCLASEEMVACSTSRNSPGSLLVSIILFIIILLGCLRWRRQRDHLFDLAYELAIALEQTGPSLLMPVERRAPQLHEPTDARDLAFDPTAARLAIRRLNSDSILQVFRGENAAGYLLYPNLFFLMLSAFASF